MALVLAPGFLAGCSESSPRVQPSVTASAGALLLEPSPNILAQAPDAAVPLEAAFVLGGANSDLGYIADVAFDGNGSFRILDRMNRHVVRYSRNGERVEAFGRQGPGPGELADPWAMTSLGSAVVVWDRNRQKAFTVFDSSGSLVGTASAPVGGDWLALQLREPDDRFEPGYTNPPEDVTRRLGSFDSVSFVHQTQPDEIEAIARGVSMEGVRIPVYLIRYSLELEVLDTVAELSAPPLHISQSVNGAYPQFSEGYFPSRPLWATGNGWIAILDREASTISIQPTGPKTGLPSSVRWTPSHMPLVEADRLAFWEWHEIRLREHGSGRVRQWIANMSRGDRRSRREEAASKMVVPSYRPEVMALYGAGQCLWVAGFSAADNYRGTSLTLTGIGLESRQVEWFVRIPRLGSRIRAVHVDAIASTYVDDDGVVRLETYSLPDDRCESGRSHVVE